MQPFIYYIWEHHLFEDKELYTTDGVLVEIISVGKPMVHADTTPYFQDAQLRIGGILRSGCICIENFTTLSKDELSNSQSSQDSIILYIYDHTEAKICGRRIPRLALSYTEKLKKDFEDLLYKENGFLSCSSRLSEIDPLLIADWCASLAMERLQQKSERIFKWLSYYQGSWEDACYITLCRNLGFNANNETFEQLAQSIPLQVLRKHSHSQLQIEALLLGQAGLLAAEPNRSSGSYQDTLFNEYVFLQHKYALTPIPVELWRFSHTRPANYPHRRIAFLAEMVANGFYFFAQLIEAQNEEAWRNLFFHPLQGFWEDHYTFNLTTVTPQKTLGYNAINILLINTVAPLLYAYGCKLGNDLYIERALSLLEGLKGENNTIISQLHNIGLRTVTALDTQALLQMHNNYCIPKRCLECRIGYKLLSYSAQNR